MFITFKAIQLQGFEADRHLLRCLLSYIDLRDSEGPRNTSHKDYYQVQLLAQQCTTLLNKPALTSILCFALDNPLHSNKVNIYIFFLIQILFYILFIYYIIIGSKTINTTVYSIESNITSKSCTRSCIWACLFRVNKLFYLRFTICSTEIATSYQNLY